MHVQRGTYIILTHDTIPPLESGPTTFFFYAIKKALRKVLPEVKTFDNSIPKLPRTDPELLHIWHPRMCLRAP